VGTPWTTREVNPHHLPESIPVTGPDGEDVVVPGLPDGLEALDGGGRRLLGVPYDEWDAHRGGYRRDHVRVVELRAAVPGVPQARMAFPPVVPARARQRHRETGDVDVDAVIGWRCDLATGRSPADARLFCDLVPVEQPVTWSLLVDGSASAAAGGGGVFRRALLAADSVAGALAARAHPVAVSVFRSFTRERVEVHILKEFDERYRPLGPGPGLRPDGYTRLGAALRHAGRRLLDRPGPARVLVSLGDALPTDEGYDGAYARADVAKAVEELRRLGALVVHVAVAPVDPAALHEMFGPGGWREARTPEDLVPLAHDVAATLRRAS
jgi:nitric oxide reductase activation protein